jgi:hypothetical protein
VIENVSALRASGGDMDLRWVVALALGVSSCGFGHSIERPNAATLVENLGANRYRYYATRLLAAPQRGPAAPALAIAPAGAREVGMIEVSADYSGFGSEGLRTSESEFYPRLAALAGELGGTHFLVLRSTRQAPLDTWITSLTVDVLEAP